MSTSTNRSPAGTDESDGPFSLRIGERTVRADRNDELLAAVIGPEYLEEDDPEVLFPMRLEQAILIATAVQESIVAAAVQHHDLDETTDEEAWTALLAERETVDPGVRWEHNVPLVLVSSLFAPYAEKDQPIGNIAWIDPTDDVTMLETLQGVGVVELLEHGDLAAA
ncbi:hypothetical protein CIK66_16930 [Brachybacterium alimentarium]|uniref:Uncharacterized protein n=1 Tax=Brachybacterium alimentarium TaxID=47845 RepID=A0A2A3YF69_9MICO|nr:hypothetical protein [Brachybacterium alimentarium]PCC37881.1 hypothetical protein CIK66_16930 [Brachybacterium alimentarium]